MKKKIFSFTIIFILLLAYFFSDKKYTSFSDKEDLIALAEQGWLPSFMIELDGISGHEIHDLDTNKIWVSFSIEKSEVIFNNCQQVDVSINYPSPPITFRYFWLSQAEFTRAMKYSCLFENGFFYLADDGNKIYLWNVR